MRGAKLVGGVFICFLLVAACGADGEDASSAADTPSAEDSGAVVGPGTYEGELALSATERPLVSLVVAGDGSYELFVSSIGLVEQGNLQLDDDVLTISPESVDARTGSYSEGMITAPFEIGGESAELRLIQVGSPDDVYEEFLGDYLAEIGDSEFLLELVPGRRYENTLTGATGTFRIANGEIALDPDAEGAVTTGQIDPDAGVISATFPLADGSGLVEFRKLAWDEIAHYEGLAEKGMGGGTPVYVDIKPAARFELITSRPRGRGFYTIAADGTTVTIELTYTDPAENPDGGRFVMSGTLASPDPFATDNVLTIESVQYIVVMQATPSVMDLGAVELTRVNE